MALTLSNGLAMNLIITIIAGAAVGYAAKVLTESSASLKLCITIGIIGSFITNTLFQLFGFYAFGFSGSLFAGVVGASVLLFAVAKYQAGH